MAPNPHFGRSSSSYAAGFGFAASAVQLKTHRPLYRSEEAEEAAEARCLQGAERERQGARRRRSSWHHRDGASRRVLVERARHQCIDSSDATGCVQKGAATWEMGNLSKGLRQGPDAEMPDSRWAWPFRQIGDPAGAVLLAACNLPPTAAPTNQGIRWPDLACCLGTAGPLQYAREPQLSVSGVCQGD